MKGSIEELGGLYMGDGILSLDAPMCAKMIAAVMKQYSDQDDVCSLSVRELAKICLVGTGTVSASIKKLSAIGAIKILDVEDKWKPRRIKMEV